MEPLSDPHRWQGDSVLQMGLLAVTDGITRGGDLFMVFIQPVDAKLII